MPTRSTILFLALAGALPLAGCGGPGDIFYVSPETIARAQAGQNLGTAGFSMPGPMTPSRQEVAPVEGLYNARNFDRDGNYLGPNGTDRPGDSGAAPDPGSALSRARVNCIASPFGNAGSCTSP